MSISYKKIQEMVSSEVEKLDWSEKDKKYLIDLCKSIQMIASDTSDAYSLTSDITNKIAHYSDLIDFSRSN